MNNMGLSPSQAFYAVLITSFITTYVLTRQLPLNLLPESAKSRPLLFSLFSSVILAHIDRIVIWQWFRSPLNSFPSINSATDIGALALESPRGKTAMKWIAQHPDADMVHIRSVTGYSMLVPITPDGFRDLMGPAAYSVQKPYGLRKSLELVLGWGLILTEGDEHKRQRKALTPAFSLSNIRGLYPLMWRKAEEFSVHVKAEADKHGYVEISSWASKLTLDIIGHAALSQDFKTMSQPESELLTSFKYILETDTTRVTMFVLGFVLPQWFLRRLPLDYVAKSIHHCQILRGRCESILAEKKAALAENKHVEGTDMLRDIIVSNAFTDSQVVDQMMTFLAAGHETTASALTWCCYLMALHPTAQSRLFEELQANLPADSESIDHSTLDHLPYLNGACEEVLRLYPTVPVTVREVCSETVMCDVTIPKETFIVIIPYAVNRNPKFWGPDAAEFVPERWIDVAADGSQRSNKHGGSDNNLCGMTFLHGNRSCIGREFAKAELKCAVASVFSRFEVSMWKPDERVKVVGTVTTKPDVGMKVKLTSRQG